jgi:hypothetical protein
MNTTKISDTAGSEDAVYNRRRFLQNTALAVGVAQLGITSLAQERSGAAPATATAKEPVSIRPHQHP